MDTRTKKQQKIFKWTNSICTKEKLVSLDRTFLSFFMIITKQFSFQYPLDLTFILVLADAIK
jgi:hypothetical protein